MSSRSFSCFAVIVLANAGLLVWALCFGVLYAALSLGCAAGLHLQTAFGALNALSVLLAVLWVLHMAALAWLAWYVWQHPITLPHSERRTRHFLTHLTILLALAGIVGIAWVGFPILLTPPCDAPALAALFLNAQPTRTACSLPRSPGCGRSRRR